jgi:hypothetical protein
MPSLSKFDLAGITLCVSCKASPVKYTVLRIPGQCHRIAMYCEIGGIVCTFGAETAVQNSDLTVRCQEGCLRINNWAFSRQRQDNGHDRAIYGRFEFDTTAQDAGDDVVDDA